MVKYKSEDEIQLMRESAQILGKAHGEVAGLNDSFFRVREGD